MKRFDLSFGLFFALSLLIGSSNGCAVEKVVTEKLKKERSAKENTPEKLGHFGSWRAFSTTENGKKVCYMLSFPISQEGDYKKRGKPYLMITHRPEDESFNVFSAYAGYKYSKDKNPVLTIIAGKTTKKFDLFVEGESAWASTDEMDQELTKMIIKTAQKIIIKGQSLKGTKTVDIYSLTGSFIAYKAICDACGLKNSKIL